MPKKACWLLGAGRQGTGRGQYSAQSVLEELVRGVKAECRGESARPGARELGCCAGLLLGCVRGFGCDENLQFREDAIEGCTCSTRDRIEEPC